jgi:hypothetical protein
MKPLCSWLIFVITLFSIFILINHKSTITEPPAQIRIAESFYACQQLSPSYLICDRSRISNDAILNYPEMFLDPVGLAKLDPVNLIEGRPSFGKETGWLPTLTKESIRN